MKRLKHLIASILLVAVAVCGLCFTACSGSDDKIKQLQTQITALEEKIDKNNNDKDFDDLQNLINSIKDQVGNVSDQLDSVGPDANEVETQEIYDKIKYIDSVLSDRDGYNGKNFKLAVKWILWNLYEAGYSEEEAFTQEFSYSPRNKYVLREEADSALSAVVSYELSEESYTLNGRKYIQSEDGTYAKVNSVTMNNIVAVKKGKSDKQIIIGSHFDGTGTGDNGSGIALNLNTAQHFYGVETEYTLVFVFFNAEEFGCYGSTAFANQMTEKQIEDTLYMINMDSLVCGDYCCLYGGVADKENKTVVNAEAYYNAVNVAKSIGEEFKTNPWTYENPAPGYDEPDYPSPTTGDWSDHAGFKKLGIKYLYFEATNWEIPGPYNEYDGYGETYLIGMLMNTSNDYLEYIEKYFPGRIEHHISKFNKLLKALLVQDDIDF